MENETCYSRYDFEEVKKGESKGGKLDKEIRRKIWGKIIKV